MSIMHRGIETFGKQAVAAMLMECRQIYGMNVMGDRDTDNLTSRQKKDAVCAKNMNKGKR